MVEFVRSIPRQAEQQQAEQWQAEQQQAEQQQALLEKWGKFIATIFIFVIFGIFLILLLARTYYGFSKPISVHNWVTVPKHYHINLVFENSHHYKGEAIINVEVIEQVKEIKFYSLHLTVEYNKIQLIDTSDAIYIPHKYSYDASTHLTTIAFATLEPGSYVLHINFKGIITDDYKDGFAKFPTGSKEESDSDLYVMNFQAQGGRRIFPCWDELTMWATFYIAIQHPENTVATSNIPQLDSYRNKTGLWTVFKTTGRLPPYFLQFIIYNNQTFVKKNLGEIENIEVLYRNHTEMKYTLFAQDVAVDVLNVFPANNDLTLLIPRGEQILYNEETDPIARKLEIIRFISSELIYHKIGYEVIPNQLSFLWINKGLAALFAHDIIERILSSNVHDLLLVQAHHECLHMDTDNALHPLNRMLVIPSHTDSVFFHQYHLKAFLILRMLQHGFTPEIFWDGFYYYFASRRMSTPSDLWRGLQLAVQNSDFLSFNVKRIMYSWVHEVGYPIVNVRRDATTNAIHMSIDPDTSRNISYSWFIPLSLITKDRYNYNLLENMPDGWLTTEEPVLILEKVKIEDWIIINFKESGYYRVNYDSTIWALIGKFLKTPNYDIIPVLNRAKLIDDAYHLMMQRKLDPWVFFQLTKYLGPRERNFIAWYPMIKVFQYMSSYFRNIYYVPFKEHSGQLLYSLLQDIGFRQKATDDELTIQLREEAMHWACVMNTLTCKRRATNELNRYIAKPAAYKFWPGWKEWTHCKGLMLASADTWGKLFAMWMNKPNNDTLGYFACSENKTIIYKYLRPISSDDTYAIMSHYQMKSFLSVVARHASNKEILKLILKHFKQIKPRMISADKALIVIINNVCTVKQLNMILKIVKDVTQNEDMIRTKIKSRSQQIKEIRK